MSTKRISNSFSEDQTTLMAMLMRQVTLGQIDVRMISRHPEFSALYRKVHAMEAKVKGAQLDRMLHEVHLEPAGVEVLAKSA